MSSKGARSDLIAVKRKIDSGASVGSLWDGEDTFPAMVRYSKAFTEYQRRKPNPRASVDVTLVVGKAGVGKSTFVNTYYPRGPTRYDKEGGHWWDDYDGQQIVFLDEFVGQIPYVEWLKLCDGTVDSFRGQVKGSHVNIAPTTVIMCSNYHPETWWSKCDHVFRPAIYRRFSRVIYIRYEISWNLLRSSRDFNVYDVYSSFAAFDTAWQAAHPVVYVE